MKHCVYFDFIKELAIMRVIANHTVKLYFDPISVTRLMVVVIRNFLGCCVPLFVAASGYFLDLDYVSEKYENHKMDRMVWGSVYAYISVSYAYFLHDELHGDIAYDLACKLYRMLPQKVLPYLGIR